jgi:hypothetical protein
MGACSTLWHQNNIHVWSIDGTGKLWMIFGDPPTQWRQMGEGFLPNQRPAIGRVHPDPKTMFYSFIWVSGETANGVRTYRNWQAGQPLDWYGPFDAV